MAKRKKSAPRRRRAKGGKVTRRRGSRKNVAMASGTGLLALVAGAAIGNAVKDNAALAKLLPNPRTRYLVLGGAGLAVGTGLIGGARIPSVLKTAMLGMGAAMVPAILPTIPGMAPAASMGRLSADQMTQLRAFVAKQRALHESTVHAGGGCDIDIFKGGVNGRSNVITGRHNVITGRRAVGVITGAKSKHYGSYR